MDLLDFLQICWINLVQKFTFFKLWILFSSVSYKQQAKTQHCDSAADKNQWMFLVSCRIRIFKHHVCKTVINVVQTMDHVYKYLLDIADILCIARKASSDHLMHQKAEKLVGTKDHIKYHIHTCESPWAIYPHRFCGIHDDKEVSL